MKAILFTQPGGPEVLHYGETADPVPGVEDLLVRVRAAGVNRADTLQRRGGYAPPPGASPILGMELAGEVIQAAGNWHIGDRVMAVVTGGAYAEKVVLPAAMALPVPVNLSFEQGASIPEAFLTAHLNLFTLGQLQAGETVLIHAGASGVGTAAIQLAKAAGARVFTTAGTDSKLARCRELGAELAINYKTGDFADQVLKATEGKGVDVILDFVGAPYWESNLKAFAIGGRLLSIGLMGGSRGQLDMGLIMGKSLTVTGTTLRRYPLPKKITLTHAFADYSLPRFASGEFRPVVDTVLPLSEATKAHEIMESNSNIGKIILRVD